MKQLPAWANWLARDEGGELWAFEKEPKKNEIIKEWDMSDLEQRNAKRVDESEKDKKHSHIKWTDEEPTSVSDIKLKPTVELYTPVVRAEKAHTSRTVSKMENTTDCIRPDHYKGKIDRMTVWEQSYSEEECRGAYKAVIDRYVSRYDRKNGVEDLRKAEECLRRLIEWEESECKP